MLPLLPAAPGQALQAQSWILGLILASAHTLARQLGSLLALLDKCRARHLYL